MKDWTVKGGAKKRLDSRVKLTPEQFRDVARQLRIEPIRARKIGYVAARQAKDSEVVETRWNGEETRNTARQGDWIVTSLSPRRHVLRDSEGHENRYVVTADRFPDLYEPAQGKAGSAEQAIYRAKGVVSAIRLDGGFDILAPWGERQTAPDGYLILNGAEVYGNNAETFAETYEVIEG